MATVAEESSRQGKISEAQLINVVESSIVECEEEGDLRLILNLQCE